MLVSQLNLWTQCSISPRLYRSLKCWSDLKIMSSRMYGNFFNDLWWGRCGKKITTIAIIIYYDTNIFSFIRSIRSVLWLIIYRRINNIRFISPVSTFVCGFPARNEIFKSVFTAKLHIIFMFLSAQHNLWDTVIT